MAFWRVIALALAASIFVEAKSYQNRKREARISICDPTYNNSSNVQCYCVADSHYRDIVRGADCHLTKDHVSANDKDWSEFTKVKNVTKLTLSNTRGIALAYIPTDAIKLMPLLMKLEIKYGDIKTVEPFAFANLSLVEEIVLSGNQIEILAVNAFANHRDLTVISLDTNDIVEINRNVFVDLPSLEKLYLTNNKITTLHDKAFVHLINLKELEIDRNSIFSLNSETFSGLKMLHKLDLSGNGLEVIGDNTFKPLTKLKTLNLDGNKIQMLDDKAFKGLENLYALSLARNNLTRIVSEKLFEDMHSLALLNLKKNQLVEFKFEAISPIISNFYGNTSSLDVEDNNFPCDCHLDWFMVLVNKTQNQYLRLAVENLKCNPSESLRELWSKVSTTTAAQAEDEQPPPNEDYEYYDEGQLDGKLFYMDIRDVANCTKDGPKFTAVTQKVNEPIKPADVTTRMTTETIRSSQPTPKIDTTGTTKRMFTTTTTVTTVTVPAEVHNGMILNKPKDEEAKNKETFTTTRLATVSAKPIEQTNSVYDHDMPSDEAGRPERIKAHRSIQEERNVHKENNAHAKVSNVFVVAVMLCFRLCF